MKSRVFPIISLLALVVAMTATASAFAQSPAQDVYNPNGEVLDVVQGGGTDNANNNHTPTHTVPSTVPEENGASVCSAADGRDASGNAVTYGSAADCSTATPTVSSNELPFTGFQAGLVALAGALLLGTGFAMRRVARRDSA
jgi:hypothetical protein